MFALFDEVQKAECAGDPHEDAFWRAAVQVQAMLEKVLHFWESSSSHVHAHRREALQMRGLRESVQQPEPPG